MEENNRNHPARVNPMGVRPIPRLMLSMAAPMMLSMLVQALYNVVDSYYVSRITSETVANMGDKAVSALTLVFPVQLLITALCVGTGVGVNAVLSRSLGAGDRERASRAAGNQKLLSICYCILTVVFGALFGRAFLRGQASDGLTLEMAESYLSVITGLSLAQYGYMCYEKLLQSTGKAVLTMIGQLCGAVTNILLDPILIFGRMGLPAMGVKGAALATVIGQGVGALVVIVFHYSKNKEIGNGLRYLRPDWLLIGEIYRVGAPAIVMQSLGSVSAYGLNRILGMIHPGAIAAYGIYNRLQSFIFMPIFGLNNADVPIVAYNLGARKRRRIFEAIRTALLFAGVIMLTGTLIVELFAPRLAGIFSLSPEAGALCITALRIIGAGYLLVGCNVVLSGVCQALGSGLISLLSSCLRQLIIILPGAWLLSRLPGAESLVWIVFPVAEAVALVVTIPLFRRLYLQRVKDMPLE